MHFTLFRSKIFCNTFSTSKFSPSIKTFSCCVKVDGLFGLWSQRSGCRNLQHFECIGFTSPVQHISFVCKIDVVRKSCFELFHINFALLKKCRGKAFGVCPNCLELCLDDSPCHFVFFFRYSTFFSAAFSACFDKSSSCNS
jgi:hypothetical protein